MPAGLRVWDAEGRLIVDLTSRLGRIIGQIDVGATQSGSVTVPGGFGQVWVYPIQNDSMGYTPTITLQADGLTFNYAPNPNFPGGARAATILYGVR